MRKTAERELLDLIIENQLRIMYDLSHRQVHSKSLGQRNNKILDKLLTQQITRTAKVHNDINSRE